MLARWVGIFTMGVAAGAWLMTVTTASEAQREAEYRDELRGLIAGVSAESAAALNAKLTELHGNEIHTERVIHTETIQPVFRNVCASDEYVQLFNETSAAAASTLSGGGAGSLSGSVAAPGRANGK
ncbi:hypothetical protein LU604_15960 [Erwinia tracheiphila]|uniref:Uncharacterized protein n=1 Tax=Erwinia tracheiphila TaxID=65700 RepID=A0A345CPG9_9GAMM|nr:hypothetical protein [Erwinia tracheiphila]AXF75336.1 hypothetical protein AV903_03220 [Erwinia tracheiphila]UIA82117.1 hypothetical protein LU604_15960 [Erwinia tracheiphila]UIA90713.1 hypothetical protein LU632_15515 [Erwinia tracheiphila]